jgi:hypothetical protein
VGRSWTPLWFILWHRNKHRMDSQMKLRSMVALVYNGWTGVHVEHGSPKWEVEGHE